MGPSISQGSRPHARPQEKGCHHRKTQFTREGLDDLHSHSNSSLNLQCHRPCNPLGISIDRTQFTLSNH